MQPYRLQEQGPGAASVTEEEGFLSIDEKVVTCEGDANSARAIDSFLQYAPAVISDRGSRPSSSMVEMELTKGDADKSSSRYEECSEVCTLVYSLLCDLCASPEWQVAITRVVMRISESYTTNSPSDKGDSHQPQIVEPNGLVDVLGVALLMAGPDLGVHVGSLVENYHSNSPCHVLSLNKTSGYVTLIGWNTNTSMFQVTYAAKRRGCQEESVQNTQ